MNPSRRSFFKKTAGVALALPLVNSVEEYVLHAQGTAAAPKAPVAGSKATLPTGTIGKVKISRLICGGNLISGYAHSRDLIYVSTLLKAYFTEEKIMETWARCEEHGINTMLFTGDDRQACEIYKNYRARGGKIQLIAQLSPQKETIAQSIKAAVDIGAVGVVLCGNNGDSWSRENSVDKIGDFITMAKSQGVIAGVGGHEIHTPAAVEKAGINPDFYMKTLHSADYWSKRKPDQMKEVIDNYGVDNYWCMDPKGTIDFMSEINRPWIAYKVLAAGAITPQAGFRHAFENGADFAAVGMFDFQVTDNVAIANAIIKDTKNRDRRWMA